MQQLKAQLYQINLTIQEKTADQSRIQQEISKLRGKLQLTPAIAQEYKALTRDYQTALNIYTDLLKKQNDSEMATDLERRAIICRAFVTSGSSPAAAGPNIPSRCPNCSDSAIWAQQWRRMPCALGSAWVAA